MFSMIPCSSDCIYQVDGYCTLETPTIVTNISNHGCVHRIQVKKRTASSPTRTYCFKCPLPMISSVAASNASLTCRTPMI